MPSEKPAALQGLHPAGARKISQPWSRWRDAGVLTSLLRLGIIKERIPKE